MLFTIICQTKTYDTKYSSTIHPVLFDFEYINVKSHNTNMLFANNTSQIYLQLIFFQKFIKLSKPRGENQRQQSYSETAASPLQGVDNFADKSSCTCPIGEG